MNSPSDSSSLRAILVARLIRDARQGCPQALGQLSEECRQYLLAIAYTELNVHLRPKTSGSDIVQQTLLEACRDFEKFRGDDEAQLLAWLKQILVHNLANIERHYFHTAKRDVAREVPFTQVAPEDSSAPFEATIKITPQAEMESREELHQLERAVHRLPDALRDVILLHHQQALPFPEVAVRMKRSPEAVRKLWVRAIKRLQDLLNDVDEQRLKP
jgi:RNA polymerase sigma-70 factor (ECF subfamily)